jgi:polyhydroxybutyrate depolymerase
MTHRFQKIFFFILLLTCNASAQTDSLLFGGIWRTYILHLPSYSGNTTLPLIIALNGLGGTASGFETMTGFSTKADIDSFIVVYLNGTGSPANWNCGGNWFNLPPPAILSNSDDVGYISTLIDTLSKRYKIDSTRAYAAGFSNGSMMAYRLAAELSNKIAAIAAGSGPMTLHTIHPSYPVAVIHFHALDDSSIPYVGETNPHAPVYFPPIDTLMAVWRNINGCTAIADTIVNVSGVVGRKWSAVSTGADVVLYRSNTGGHAWPIGGLAETDIAWNFLKTHSRTPATGTIVHNAHETPQAFSLDQNYPNPFNPTTTIGYKIPMNGHVSLKVYDILGREVVALVDEKKDAGSHDISFNASKLPSGVYFYRLQTGSFTETKKLVLIR